jgi:hypothetical protein
MPRHLPDLSLKLQATLVLPSRWAQSVSVNKRLCNWWSLPAACLRLLGAFVGWCPCGSLKACWVLLLAFLKLSGPR